MTNAKSFLLVPSDQQRSSSASSLRPFKSDRNASNILKSTFLTHDRQATATEKQYIRQINRLRQECYTLGRDHSQAKSHPSPWGRHDATETPDILIRDQSMISAPVLEYRQSPLKYKYRKNVQLTLPICAYSMPGERVVCNNAPCVKPLTYHTIGYRVEDSADKYSHSDTFYRTMSVRRPIASHNIDSILLREYAVRNGFRQIRQRHRRNQIADWSVTYGEKIPLSLLRNLRKMHRGEMSSVLHVVKDKDVTKASFNSNF